MVIDQYVSMIRRNIVPDQNLVEQCRKLYAQHRSALDLILRYGEVNAFEIAANAFFKSHSDVKVMAVRPSRAVFLPEPLYQIVPELEGTAWFGQSRPVAFWFYLRPDNRFGLIVEIGPFTGEKFSRERLVKNLLSHFGSNSKIYPKYTRVCNEYKKLTEDQVSDPAEMENAMNAVYETVTSKHLSAITDILATFFRS
jgi:hypothetical protein